jgi:RNA polymerase subunit RPABC4/transcription elongation factor Spt4
MLEGFPSGSLESAAKLVGLVLFAYALVLWLSAIVWVYRDVKHRTNDPASQMIAVLLVALFNVPGLIVYLVIRPQATMADAYERSLEAEALLHELQLSATACQACHRPIEDDFNVCPHCRTLLREPCRSCGRSIRTSWATCPYCATDRIVVQPRPAGARSQPLAESPVAPLEPPVRARTVIEDGNVQSTTRPPVARQG